MRRMRELFGLIFAAWTTAAGAQVVAVTPLGPEAMPRVGAVLAGAARDYAHSANALAGGAVRRKRAEALCAQAGIKAAGYAVRDWAGTVWELDAAPDGRGVLGVEVRPGYILRTARDGWGERMGDPPTLLTPGDPVHTVASALRLGQAVRFSGAFVAGPTDCMKELSRDAEGAMNSPQFLFRFTALAPTGG